MQHVEVGLCMFLPLFRVSQCESVMQSTKMMDEFMRLAKGNTIRNLETCGVLAGSLVSRIHVQSGPGVLIGGSSIGLLSCPGCLVEHILHELMSNSVDGYCLAEEGHFLCVHSHHTKTRINIRFGE